MSLRTITVEQWTCDGPHGGKRPAMTIDITGKTANEWKAAFDATGWTYALVLLATPGQDRPGLVAQQFCQQHREYAARRAHRPTVATAP